ncbi:acylneuraminate cytidylyltransferase family protein [Chryseobacterium indoltheticum]|jgi:CMP-N-acetylneuraminic acid synthetase|uniref:acylneuraminate cytidylyltransferase family protein n=1 Tax=Chryseobacterium indoltheticum TaxID=254 RepID=UPI00242A7A88|nr:acylneuraminate cytidylyltransferase family protein [Chryseobacterium indoltheticum]MDF2832921.1 acylneuraminate cytidylyltransferase family protein [Chryseobacterium indoltheticum]
MKGLVTICARGGSKGIPGKNIKPISGKPLIEYSLIVAKELSKKYNLDIFLSTDSEEIKNVVNSLQFPNVNLEYNRPDFLASDTAGKLDVISDVYQYAEKTGNKIYDFVLDLDVTSPLRTAQDLSDSIEFLFSNSEALNLFSVSPANRNPYFNMVEEKENGFFELCKKGQFLTRQSAPRVFDMNASFYVFKKEFFEENHKTVITDKSIIYEVPHLCFDLDHQIDFEFMSFLLENRKLDFDFNY